MQPLNLIPLAAYLTLMVVVGRWAGRRVRSSGDFFVAGRRLPAPLLFATLLAANIGAGSTVLATGRGYEDGIAAWWWVGSAGLGSLALAFWVGPLIHRAAARHDLKTVGDFLELHFGPWVRGLIASLLWLATLSILAGQIIAMAWVLGELAGVPKTLGCLVGALVMTLYFGSGGLVSSAWVNLMQLGVLLAGFALALPFALSSAGGGAAVLADVDWGTFWRSGNSGWTYLPLLAPAFIVSPGLLQKIYGARDERTVRWAVAMQGLVLMVFACFPVLLGLAAARLFPGLEQPEMALPRLLAHGVPVLVGSLGLAAIISAEISSADAILFMLSTSLSQDLYRRFINPQADDRQVVKAARIAAYSGGALAALLAVLLDSVLSSLTIFYSLLSVSLFVPIIAGLHRRRTSAAEGLAALACGVPVAATLSLPPARGLLPNWITPEMAGLATSGLGFLVVVLVRASRSSDD